MENKPINTYRLKGKLLYHKFWLFLLPSVVSAISVALSELVDGIMLSNLVGPDGLVVLTLGSPILFLISAIYMLLGVGGSLLYSQKLGEGKTEEANGYYNCAMFIATGAGILLMVLALLFRPQITMLLSAGSSLQAELGDYLFYVFISFPFLIIFFTYTMFLPVFGRPILASVSIFVSIVIDLIMDYVFIQILGMGIKGAALATLAGDLVAAVLIVIVLLKTGGGVPLLPARQKFDLKQQLVYARTIITKGLSAAVSQASFMILTIFCNYTASRYGGDVGIEVLALCLQTQSIVSIALAAGCDSIIPIVAVLEGQKDMEGIPLLAKKVAYFIVIYSTACTILFMMRPDWLCALYGKPSAEVRAGFYHAIRIFALYYPLRSLIILYRDVINALEREIFALVISVVDGFVGIILFCLILCPIFGLDGLWLTYPVNTVFTALLIAGYVFYQHRHGKEPTKGLLLLPLVNADDMLSLEFLDTDADISAISTVVSDFCVSKGIDNAHSLKAGLITEEMAVYSRAHHQDYPYMNILVQIEDGNIIIEFRNLGPGFSPASATPEDDEANIKILNVVPVSMEYEYAIGMNLTTVTIKAA